MINSINSVPHKLPIDYWVEIFHFTFYIPGESNIGLVCPFELHLLKGTR